LIGKEKRIQDIYAFGAFRPAKKNLGRRLRWFLQGTSPLALLQNVPILLHITLSFEELAFRAGDTVCTDHAGPFVIEPTKYM